MTNKENLTILCLGGFKKDNISEVKWALENFAEAAGIKIYSGIKNSYDCERDSYTFSFRFFKELLAQHEQKPLSDEDLKQIYGKEKFDYLISKQLFNVIARRIETAHDIGVDNE